ncbi:hypothetical protein E6C27_scaffold588G00500 [Cucumis melo var. makuwa]|uniref:Uncharacterized protein n=1 Tax=Cucumis melo var. makuwa TaxID=1194695 RepID=A0A5A7TJ00_CUCMM|nr:hypothetical protein E6C27_scaffold588G00500 [Cucumis melo var. makuwa]
MFDRSYREVDLTKKARSSPSRSWIADDAAEQRCLIIPTKAVDLMANVRSSPSRSWIADGRVTSANDCKKKKKKKKRKKKKCSPFEDAFGSKKRHDNFSS